VVFAILSHKMSQHGHPMPKEGVVTSDAIHGKKLITKNRSIIAVIVILIILAFAGLFVFIHNNQSLKVNETGTTPKATNNNSKQQLLAAITKAQMQVNNSKTSSQKASAYYNLGAAYLNNNQATQAIAAYQNSDSAISSDNPNELGISIGLGFAYNAIGQTSEAINAFQQTINLLEQSNDPYLHNKVITYQTIVQRLQQGLSI